MTQPTQTKELD